MKLDSGVGEKKRVVLTIVVSKQYVPSHLQENLPVGKVLGEGTRSTSGLFADVSSHTSIERIATNDLMDR